MFREILDFTGDMPTLFEIVTMKGTDGNSLNIILTIAAADYMTFGIYLLQDENGVMVDFIERNHRQYGSESVTYGIFKKWLTSEAPTCTYQHLIECLRQSELGALAEEIVDARSTGTYGKLSQLVVATSQSALALLQMSPVWPHPLNKCQSNRII